MFHFLVENTEHQPQIAPTAAAEEEQEEVEEVEGEAGAQYRLYTHSVTGMEQREQGEWGGGVEPSGTQSETRANDPDIEFSHCSVDVTSGDFLQTIADLVSRHKSFTRRSESASASA